MNPLCNKKPAFTWARPRAVGKVSARQVRRAAVMAVALGCAAGASADDFFWNQPLGGSWSTAEHWAPTIGAPPNRLSDSASLLLAARARVAATFAVGTLTVGTDAGIDILEDAELSVGAGGASVLGQIRVADRGHFRFVEQLGFPTVRLLSGAGELRLDGSQARFDSDAGVQVRTAPEVRIAGWGRLALSATFEGPVIADEPGQQLAFTGSTVHAEGVLSAANGGILKLDEIDLTLGPDGRLVAQPGGLVKVNGGTIRGGTIEGAGGVMNIETGVSLDGVSLRGDIGVPALGSMLVLSPVLQHTAGALTLGGAGPVAGISEFICFEPVTLTGNGSIVMAPATDPDGLVIAARIGVPAGAALTLANGYTMLGTGLIDGNLQVGVPGGLPATLDPGTPTEAGRLDVTGSVLLNGESVLKMDVFGPTGFDTIVCAGAVAVGGALEVSMVGGFDPAPGTAFVLIASAAVTWTGSPPLLPTLSGTKVARVRAEADGLVLRIGRCAADFTLDGEINADDLAEYINCFFASPSCAEAEMNGDGAVNADDLGDFINAYFAGCD